MQTRLFTLFFALLFLAPLSHAQQRGQVLGVVPRFALSPAQARELINGSSPIDVPELVLNLLTDIRYPTLGFKVVYGTINANGNPTIASGLVVVPVNLCPKDMMVYCHGTVFDKDDVPSNFSDDSERTELVFGLLYGGNGYLTVLPDYLGLGQSPGLHLYLDEETQASATLDLMIAARNLASFTGVELSNQAFISGYSQGGHAGMSTFRLLQEANDWGFDLRSAGLGSGPYDLSGIQYKGIIDDPFYANPQYLLYTIASCEAAYGNIYNSPSDILLPPYDELYETHILGQTGDVSWVVSPYTDMLQADFYQQVINDPNNPIRQCLAASDVHDWDNRKPTAMYFCTQDEQVNFRNSIRAERRFEANLPWQLFWMRALINSKWLGHKDHFECVLPYILVSKLGFDLQQTRCAFPAPGAVESRQQQATPERFAERPFNYHYVDIRTESLATPLEKVTLLQFDGNPAASFTDFSAEKGRVRIDVRSLERGPYVLRLADANGHRQDELIFLEEMRLLKHRDYTPLSYREETAEYELDLSLLPEPVQSLLIYDQDEAFLHEIEAGGAVKDIHFTAKGMPPGPATLEVRTATNSYFLELPEPSGKSGAGLLSVFPNPTHNRLNIRLSGDELIRSAALFDAQGRQLWSRENVDRQVLQPDVQLPAGAYQLRVVTISGKVLVERVFVIR